MTVQQVAARLQLSEWSILQAIKKGELEASEWPRPAGYRISAAQLQAYIERRKAQPRETA